MGGAYTSTMKDRLFSGFTERAVQARDQWATKIAAGRPMDLTTVYDCMGSNLGKFPVPHGVLMAGYTTGSGGVPWTPQQFAAHPGAIRIDQSPINTPADELADVIDVEQFAATIADIPAWVRAARANWAALTRPGQRWPMIYCSGNTLTPVANALNAAGITSGVSLWLAKPMTIAAATDMLSKAGGPFPIDAIQHTFLGDHDVSLFNTAWLGNVSGKTPAPPPNTKFTVQVERYQPGFGWVLSTTFETPPAERYRARVFNGDWSDWQEFTP